MKKILFIAGLLAWFGASSQVAYFPDVDSLRKFIDLRIRNSAIDAFTNLRLNTALKGIAQFLDSARLAWGGGGGGGANNYPTTMTFTAGTFTLGRNGLSNLTVSITTSNVPESGGVLYFTTARARQSITAGYAMLYDNVTGIVALDTSALAALSLIKKTGYDTTAKISGNAIRLKPIKVSIGNANGFVNDLTDDTSVHFQIMPSAGGDYFYVKDAGADSTGTSDISAYINWGLSNNKTVVLGKGNWKITSTINVPARGKVQGVGPQTKVVIGTNITAFNLANYSQVENMRIVGNQGNISQRGVNIDSVIGAKVINMMIDSMGVAIRVSRTGLVPTPGFTFGIQLVNNYGESNGYGIFADTRGEYITATNNSFNNGTYGIYNEGGNNTYIGGNFDLNQYGGYWTSGSNNAHCSAVGVKFNHCATSLYVTGVTLGYRFVGCMFYYGGLTILNSTNITFSECDIDVTGSVLTSTTNTGLYFSNCFFYSSPTWTVTGAQPTVVAAGGFGYTITDVTHSNKTTSFTNTDGQVGYGGDPFNGARPSITQHLFYQSISTFDGGADATRGLNAGRARFDLAATTGDGVIIYKTGSSGANLAIYDNAANYQLYGKTSGLFAFGNNTSPTAVIDITGQTTAAAPLRIRSSVAPTSPNDGDLWNESGIFKLRATTTQSIVTDANTLTLSNKTIASGIFTGPIAFNANDQIAMNSSNMEFRVANGSPKMTLMAGGTLVHVFGVAYQGFQTITSGTTTTISADVHVVVTNPGSVLASHTITMPASPNDGQEIRMVFGGTVTSGAVVTALTISANSGQGLIQVSAPTTANAGDCFIYLYKLSNTKWYRIK